MGIHDLHIQYVYEPLIEMICIHNYSVATSFYLDEYQLEVIVICRMKIVILAVLALVMAFLALLYLNLQPDMEWTLEGGILRVLSMTGV